MTNVLIVDDSDVDRLLMEGLIGQSTSYMSIQAENGVQALKKLTEWPIDVVLTDMQMPQMDGLELVKRIREDKIQVPVILTTGKGSEELAAKALRAGASGYIPKSDLNQMLVPTVQEVLEIFQTNHRHRRLLEFSRGCHYEFKLSNDPTLIPVMVDFCDKTLQSITPLDRIDCLRISVAVDQALQNALFRGNLEIDGEHRIPSPSRFLQEEAEIGIQQRLGEAPYKDRRIKVVMEVKKSGFAISIRDDGPGFDTSLIGDWSNLALRGTNLMIGFMDSVKYNSKGNQVKMLYLFDREKVKAKKKTKIREANALQVGNIVCQTSGESHPIKGKKFVIGRRSACHLRLTDEKVAPLHCMLVKGDDNLLVLNLTPEFKTFVNGESGSGMQLNDGDRLQVGGQTYVFESA